MFQILLVCLIGNFPLIGNLPAAAADAGWSAWAADEPDGKMRLGINFAGPADWNTELPFCDVFKLSRPWLSQRHGAGWGQGPELELDPRGFIKRLQPGCFAETPLCTIEGGHYPSGRYTVWYRGRGKIEFSGAATTRSTTPSPSPSTSTSTSTSTTPPTSRGMGKIEIDVDAKRGGFFMRLMETDPDDLIRDLHVILPGYEDRWKESIWRDEFLEAWKGMSVFRAMDWQHTNNSEIESVDDFPELTDATYTPHGLPIELICDFANRTGIDPWFCVPHRANDAAVRHMAKTIHTKLDPERKVLVEYSNEVWNAQFKQAKFAQAKGQALGLAEKPWEAGWKFTSKRSLEIFEIFDDVFAQAGKDFENRRVIRVLPAQAANAFVAQQIVAAFDAAQHADVLAIAPYVSMNVRPEQAESVITLGVDGILEKARRESLPKAIDWIRKNHQVAQAKGLRLYAYEAGQHLVGVGDAVHNEALTKLLQAANRSPQMGILYDDYFAAWEAAGGELMCLFSSTGRYSKWGSWGLREYADQDESDAPKFRSTMRWLRK
ncbi:MAG: hypothetical protein AAF958_09450 [Planctomycetota bacterium]